MENFESYTQDLSQEEQKMGKRVAQRLGNMLETAGEKVDSAIDCLNQTKQTLKDSVDQVRFDGYEGIKKRTFEYTRNDPFKALLFAMAAGLFLGWVTKRGK